MLVLALLIVGVYVVVSQPGVGADQVTPATTSSPVTEGNTSSVIPVDTASPSATTQSFADSQYAINSVQIAPGDLSADATAALANYTFATQTLSDGSIQADLTPKTDGATTQEFIVQSGYTLYFVKPAADGTASDKIAVLVDQNGNIVQ